MQFCNYFFLQKGCVSKTKKAPDEGRGQPKCFHNGIILIVICNKLVVQNYTFFSKNK